MKHKNKFFIIIIFSLLLMLWTGTVWAAPVDGFAVNQNLISSNLNQDGGWQSSAGTVQLTDDGLKVDSSKNFTIYQEISLPDDNMSYTAAFSVAQKNKSGVLSKEDQGSVEIIFIKADGSKQDSSIKLTAASYEEWYTRAQEFTIPTGTSKVRIELNGISRKISILNRGAAIDTYFKDIYFGISSMTFGQGDGSAQNPYLIYSTYGLQFMAQNLNSDAYYRLQNTIDMTGVEWKPIGDKLPKDHFDYNGFTINGLTNGFFGYTINFVTNGGTEVAPVSDVVAGTVLTDIATTTKDGYTFNGWYRDESLSQAVTVVDGDMTVYASWNIQQYTINFVVNRGDMTVAPMGVNYNSTATLPVLECHGFTFGGWFTNIELTQPFSDDTPITSNVTLYAKWEDNGIGMLIDIGKGDITFEKLDDTHFYMTQNGKTSVDYENDTIISVTGSTSENQLIIKEGVNVKICLTSLQITTVKKNPISIMQNATVRFLTKGNVTLQTSEKLSGIYLAKGSYLYLDGEITIDSKKDMAVGVNGEQNGQGVFIVQNGKILTKTNKSVQILIKVLIVIAIIILVLIVYMWVSVQLRRKGLLQKFSSRMGTHRIKNKIKESKPRQARPNHLQSERVEPQNTTAADIDISNVMAKTKKAYGMPVKYRINVPKEQSSGSISAVKEKENELLRNRVNLSGTKLTDTDTDSKYLYGEKMEVDVENLALSTEYQPYETQKNLQNTEYVKTDEVVPKESLDITNSYDMYAEQSNNEYNIDSSLNNEDTTDIYISSKVDDGEQDQDKKVETLNIDVTATPYIDSAEGNDKTVSEDEYVNAATNHIDLNDISQLNELDENSDISEPEYKSENNLDGYTNDYIENYMKEYSPKFTRQFKKDDFGNFIEVAQENGTGDSEVVRENDDLYLTDDTDDEETWYEQQLKKDKEEQENSNEIDGEQLYNPYSENELIDDFANDPEEEMWFKAQVAADSEDYYDDWQYSNMGYGDGDLMNIQTHKRNKNR